VDIMAHLPVAFLYDRPVLLTTLFQRYRLSVPQGWRPEPLFTFPVTVKGELPVIFSRVQAKRR
jgi:hypothetical protein